MRVFPLVFLLAAAASAQTPLAEEPVVHVHVRVDGGAEVGGVAADSLGVAAAVRAYVRKHPGGAVRFGTERATSYARYIDVLDTIKAAFIAEREAVSRRLFEIPYDALADAARDAVDKRVPLRIVLAEPE